MEETYEAQGICTNCGHKNYPQWGVYKLGARINDYPCPNCGCMTWVLDERMGTPDTENEITMPTSNRNEIRERYFQHLANVFNAKEFDLANESADWWLSELEAERERVVGEILTNKHWVFTTPFGGDFDESGQVRVRERKDEEYIKVSDIKSLLKNNNK